MLTVAFWVSASVFVGVVAAVRSFGQPAPMVRFVVLSTNAACGVAGLPAGRGHAIDRDAVVRAVSPLLSTPVRAALTIQHPSLPGYNSAIHGYEYDPAKAKELLTQSGWSAPITILVGPARNKFEQTFDGAVAESLRKTLGVAVNFQSVSNFETLVRAARSGTASIYEFSWRSDSQDFGYPSIAVGIVHDVVSGPDARALAEKDSEAAERSLLEKALIVPIIHY
jgi:ABC-type oligopeptide transport system substrate-binding subunit